MRKEIDYQRAHDIILDDVRHLALIIKELTGEWLHFMPCDSIQSEGRYYYDELIYFGPTADLEVGGIAHDLEYVSQIDRYNFDEQRIGFFYNDDPECAKSNGLNDEKKWLVLYNGEKTTPHAWEYLS